MRSKTSRLGAKADALCGATFALQSDRERSANMTQGKQHLWLHNIHSASPPLQGMKSKQGNRPLSLQQLSRHFAPPPKKKKKLRGKKTESEKKWPLSISFSPLSPLPRPPSGSPEEAECAGHSSLSQHSWCRVYTAASGGVPADDQKTWMGKGEKVDVRIKMCSSTFR